MITRANGIIRISAEELRALLDAHQEVMIIDIRPPEAFFSSPLTILGAICIAPEEIGQRYARLPHHRRVVVVGEGPPDRATLSAARFLASHGFRRVAILEGGFTRWEALEYPTEPRPG